MHFLPRRSGLWMSNMMITFVITNFRTIHPIQCHPVSLAKTCPTKKTRARIKNQQSHATSKINEDVHMQRNWALTFLFMRWVLVSDDWLAHLFHRLSEGLYIKIPVELVSIEAISHDAALNIFAKHLNIYPLLFLLLAYLLWLLLYIYPVSASVSLGALMLMWLCTKILFNEKHSN